jgi:hypothetical protein
VSNTLLKADTDVNTDGHQSSKTSGKAHAQNGSAASTAVRASLEFVIQRPATVSDADADNIEGHLTGEEDPLPRGLIGCRTRARLSNLIKPPVFIVLFRVIRNCIGSPCGKKIAQISSARMGWP